MEDKKIGAGINAPKEINVIIEIIPGTPVKYEYDKESGFLVVDRTLSSSVTSYPCSYGFVPSTLSGDGDPLDVLVHTHYALLPKSVISVKPVGVLMTEDEKGSDEKILAVPADHVDGSYANINSYKELPDTFINQIEHFFAHYKDMEKGKFVKISGWKDYDGAEQVVAEAIERYNTR